MLFCKEKPMKIEKLNDMEKIKVRIFGKERELEVFSVGDSTDRKIYTESDDDGYVCVENIPDGAECFIDFLE